MSCCRNDIFVNALAIDGIFANFCINNSAFAKASSLLSAVSSIKPIFSASSVLNNRPSVIANSVSLRLIVFCIVAMNHEGATIPSWVSFKPIVKLWHIMRYSQLIANRQPPAGEWPYRRVQLHFSKNVFKKILKCINFFISELVAENKWNWATAYSFFY